MDTELKRPTYSEILSFGEPMFEFSQVAEANRDKADFLSGYGGDASNFAIAAVRLGADVGMLTQLGDDKFGKKFIRLWAGEGVASKAVSVLDRVSTGVYFITPDEDGHHFSFAGSFCTHYVAGKSLRECPQYANTTASITITGYGAVASLPTLEQVKQRIKEQEL